ncbi:hypothetical protein ACWIID_30150 [Streptomyces phaeochromogenes]
MTCTGNNTDHIWIKVESRIASTTPHALAAGTNAIHYITVINKGPVGGDVTVTAKCPHGGRVKYLTGNGTQKTDTFYLPGNNYKSTDPPPFQPMAWEIENGYPRPIGKLDITINVMFGVADTRDHIGPLVLHLRGI